MRYPEDGVERQMTFTMSDERLRLKLVVTRGTKVQIVDVAATWEVMKQGPDIGKLAAQLCVRVLNSVELSSQDAARILPKN